MINLLPPSYKKELLQEERWRIILNLEIFLFAFLIALSLILLSVKISTAGLNQTYQILSQSQGKVIKLEKIRLEKLGIQNLEEEIEKVNENLSQLGSFFEENPNLTKVSQNTAKSLPLGSYLTSISYREENSQIVLVGFCPDRESLFQFKNSLENQGSFENFYFPSSNWLSPQTFEIKFTIKNELQ